MVLKRGLIKKSYCTCFRLELMFQNSVSAKGQLISKCLWCHHFDQKTNNFFLRISALASKKRSNQKNKGTLLY